MSSFTIEDYLQTYGRNRVNESLNIASEILKSKHDKKAKSLLNRIKKVKYAWDLPQEELEKIYSLLTEIKLYLVSSYYK